jgi:hypothetical protein
MMDAPSNHLPTGIFPFQPPSNHPSNCFPTASNGVCTNPPITPRRLEAAFWGLGGPSAAPPPPEHTSRSTRRTSTTGEPQ